MYDQSKKPGSPGDILEHHGVKGMRWGFREDEELSDREIALKNEKAKGKLVPGTPDFEQRIQRLSRTDRPQTINPERSEGGKVSTIAPKKEGLSRNQKIAIGVGVVGAAGAGYYAYSKFQGSKMPGLDLQKAKQEIQLLDKLTLPSDWDVRGLKTGPISQQALGALSGTEFNAKLIDPGSLVINTSRGFADILPKDGFSTPFAKAQHDSVVRVLEEMREQFPAIRNMNIEVLPMSRHPGIGESAQMCVLPMRAGEARIMYNDVIAAPSQAIIRANKKFLPGLGVKDYVARHEMGHLLAVANGQLPPAYDLLSENASLKSWNFRATTEPLMHKKMFAKHGFTFKELSKLSKYSATEPAEAMAELAGHYFTPEMRSRLTPDQIGRAKAMFDEMGGVT